MNVTRRQFFKVCTAGVGGSSIVLMGFSPTAALAEVRSFKLARATETRNTCPYCSVSCGVLIYTSGDKSKNAHAEIIHIEGDPDNPVNRGTLCPKGAGLADMINSPNRLKHPEVREPGAKGWREEALMSYPGGRATDIWMGRTTHSRHNTSSPDMVFRRFSTDPTPPPKPEKK